MQYWKIKPVKVTPAMILLSSLIITGCQDKTSDDALLARHSTKACETEYTDYCDSDGDGISDSKEKESGWDSNDPHVPVENGNRDYDGDGIKNGRESVANWDMNDPNVPVNNGNFDSDGDGIKDGREAIEGWDSNDPNSPVIDGDADEDRDGINKGLEEIEGLSDTNPDDSVKSGDSDSDGDGIKNGKETIENWNPDDPNDPVNKGDSDSDGDGIKDGKETIEGWDPSDPNDPVASGASDDDGDGIENGQEVVNGWDPNEPNDPVVDGNIDSDGDGIPNGKETIEGWDPNDPSDPYDGVCSSPQEDGTPDCDGADNNGDDNDSFSNFSNAVCGGQLNDTDKENAKGSCLKIATASVDGKAFWYTSSPSVSLVQELGFVTFKGGINTNNGLTYADSWTESGAHGPTGGVFARFDQLSYDGVGIENSQYARWCKHLASINYAGRDNWRSASVHELGIHPANADELGLSKGQGLRNVKGNMWLNFGWPTELHYWTTTLYNQSYYLNLDLGDSQYRYSQYNSQADYASCVSE